MAESTKPLQRDEGFDPMAARRVQYDENGRAIPSADWRGEYFPGWLPEDCMLNGLWNQNGEIYFSGSGNREVGMIEKFRTTMTLWGLARYSQARLVQVNGRQGLLLVDDDDLLDQTYSLYWDDGNYNWIELFGRNVTEEELMRVAQSAYRISTGENLGAEPRSSYEETAIAVPDCWNGNYYPAYVPEEFEVLDYVDFFHSIELVSEDNRRILFSELDETVTSMRGTEGATVDTILIQGKEATIIDGWHNNIHNVTIVWPAGDNQTWFDLVTYGIETEETVHIAESVTKIDKQ